MSLLTFLSWLSFAFIAGVGYSGTMEMTVTPAHCEIEHRQPVPSLDVGFDTPGDGKVEDWQPSSPVHDGVGRPLETAASLRHR